MAKQQRTYLGLSPDARREQRRTTLMEAALDCVVDDEVELSVRAICGKARLTPRYFYESFTNLDELLVALVQQVGHEILEAGRVSADAAPPVLRDKCRAAFSGSFAVLSADPRRARLVLVTAAGSELLHEARRRLVMEYTEGLLGYFAEMLGVEVPVTDRARASALFMVGGGMELVTSVLAGSLVMPEADVADVVADLLASGLTSLAR